MKVEMVKAGNTFPIRPCLLVYDSYSNLFTPSHKHSASPQGLMLPQARPHLNDWLKAGLTGQRRKQKWVDMCEILPVTKLGTETKLHPR